MPKIKKIYLILTLSILLIFTFVNFCFARELEISYPPIPGAETPQTKPLLPDYVKYIFNLAIMIAGLVVLGVMVYGGFRYLTSAGNPTIMTDAKDQIFSAFLGLIILLSSWLILYTINPQLVKISPKIERLEMGVELCNAEEECETYSVSRSDISELEAVSYKFLSPFDDLDVYIYSEKNWEGEKRKLEAESGLLPFSPQSIELTWKKPGVYLCKDEEKRDCMVYESSSDTLGDFENEVKKIYFRNLDKERLYGAILHESRNRKGKCDVFLSTHTEESGGTNQTSPPGPNLLNNNASSITVFQFKRGEGGVTGGLTVTGSESDGVTLYKNKDYDTILGSYKEIWDSNFHKHGNSIRIEGDYIAILFENEGYQGQAEVFTQSDPSLAENDIGICGTLSNVGCLYSVIVFPHK